MYAPFFGLKQEPFSIAPDPRFLFMSERHREALAHLLYGLGGGGGFVLLTGEIGAGKTTVCRCFLEQIPKRCNVAYIFNPKLTVIELLKTVCDEFGIAEEHIGPGVATVKDYIDPLNQFLLKMHAVGRNNVLIIDEAQNLSADVLEQLRLLTNLETNERKLLQIVLIGQPELRTMLARPELEQLAQRVVARFHLQALSERETAHYIRHRLSVAGMTKAVPFEREAARRVYQWSRGLPRRINLLCDRAMLGAYAGGLTRIDRGIVDKAAREVFDSASPPPTAAGSRTRPARRWTSRITPAAGVGLAGAVVVLGVWALAMHGPWRDKAGGEGSAAASAAPASTAKAASARALASAPASAPASTAAPPSNARSAPGPVIAAPADSPAMSDTADLQRALAAGPRSEAQALRDLASAWRESIDEGDPCQVGPSRSLHCFRTGAGLALIRQLNRPGVVALRGDSADTVYGLLISLTDRQVTLKIGDARRTLSLATLAKVWRGDFVTFWRAPPGYADPIGPGRTGLAVDHLAAQLAATRSEPVPGDKQTSDAALRSKIMAFQLAQGLRADGVAGPTTFMLLHRATGVDEPRLLDRS